MSKQSERRRRQKAAAEKLLLKAQQQPSDQNTKANTGSKVEEIAPQSVLVIEDTSFLNRPLVPTIAAAGLFAAAAFTQAYNPTFAIWLLFFGLLISGHAIKIECAQHGFTPKTQNIVFIAIGAFALIICLIFQVVELQKSTAVQQPQTSEITPSISLEKSKLNTTEFSLTPREPKRTLEEELDYQSGLAQARQWEPPELPLNTHYPPWVLLTIGGRFQSGWPAYRENDPQNDQAVPIMMPGGGEPAKPYIKNNRVYVKVGDMYGSPPQTVSMNNEWPPKIPDGGDRNFNANSFEIVDSDGLPVLQVRYNSPTAIEVNGVFVSPNGSIMHAFKGLDGTAFPYVKPLKTNQIQGRIPWFKYPSKNHLGELAN